MSRRSAVPDAALWAGIAALALPVAWMVARAGFPMAVQEPWRDLAWLLVRAAAEEIVFRGGLQAALLRLPALQSIGPLRPGGLSAANLATSLVFAAAHLIARPPSVALGVLPVSLLLGWSYERSGRLWLPVALHAWFNAALYSASALG